MKRGVYGKKIRTQKSTFKYEQEGRLYLGVDNVESKDAKIIGHHFTVFGYTENMFLMISGYKK